MWVREEGILNIVCKRGWSGDVGGGAGAATGVEGVGVDTFFLGGIAYLYVWPV
jgi:hypothetical protein